MYIINYTDIDKDPIIIYPEQIDITTVDITLIGKSTMEFGEQFDENILHLMENFAALEDSDNPGFPDLTQTLLLRLDNPINGQFWYNKTTNVLHFWNGEVWVEFGNRNDVAANSGVVIHGEQIPAPQAADGYQFTHSECSWFVSPHSIVQNANYIECYTDANAVVTMRYRPIGGTNSDLIPSLVNYIIIGIRDSENNGAVFPQPSLPVPPPASPTPTVTPSITPTSTPLAGSTLTPTRTPTPTLTPTPTFTQTPTLTVTPSITPSPTVTPSVTPQVITNLILTVGYESTHGPDIDYQLGFNNTIGSLSPAVYNSVAINKLMISYFMGYQLILSMQGVVAQNAFTSIRFIDNTGTEREYASSLATYQSPDSSGNSVWMWTTLTPMFNPNSPYVIRIYA